LESARLAGTVVAMTAQRQAIGAFGERVAVRYLLDRGLTVVDRNWRCPSGEIDAVFLDGRTTLVFVEVKTRRGTSFGTPAEAVGPRKAARLRRLAALWLAAHDTHAADIRFDVVCVLAADRGPAEVEHLTGVI
jgi:putative endonuclease